MVENLPRKGRNGHNRELGGGGRAEEERQNRALSREGLCCSEEEGWAIYKEQTCLFLTVWEAEKCKLLEPVDSLSASTWSLLSQTLEKRNTMSSQRLGMEKLAFVAPLCLFV